MIRTGALVLCLSHASAFAACSATNIDHTSLQSAVSKLGDAAASLQESQLSASSVETKVAAQNIFGIAQEIKNYARTVADLVYLHQGMKDVSDKKLVDKVFSARATELSRYIPEDMAAIDRYSGFMTSAGVAAQTIALKNNISAIRETLSSCK